MQEGDQPLPHGETWHVLEPDKGLHCSKQQYQDVG